MARQVALLRGVNVGGKNTVAMTVVRDVFESIGCEDVSTYIQSGNVLFAGSGTLSPQRLEEALHARFALDISVVVRSADDLRQVVEHNPYAAADLSKVHVAFLADEPDEERAANLDTVALLPEHVTIRGRDLYLHLPNGMGRAKLPGHLERRLSIRPTVRNWTTVTKLADLLAA
ncbi:MAG TPA: DUF1697 domain-containing protein [Acidimicrobiales bacterium]|nr:DUF1697 domain-containing protein [Acidimicrobiales bacterium]